MESQEWELEKFILDRAESLGLGKLDRIAVAHLSREIMAEFMTDEPRECDECGKDYMPGGICRDCQREALADARKSAKATKARVSK